LFNDGEGKSGGRGEFGLRPADQGPSGPDLSRFDCHENSISVSSNWRNPNRRAAIRGAALGSFRRRSGRWRRRRPGGRAAANAVAKRLAGKRRLAAGSRVIKLKLLEFIVARRLDREIAVGRAVGRLED